MRNRVKTYRQFINEAYINQQGELHDFEAPSDQDVEVMSQANNIKDFLEENGAEKVGMEVIDDARIFRFRFKYVFTEYFLYLNWETDQADLYFMTQDREMEEHSSYPMDGFFDLLSAKGLNFLDY